MRPDHAALIQSTWAALTPRVGEVTTRFYARLFELAPDTRAMFAHVDMAAQRTKFGDMLAAMVRLLDDPEDMVVAIGPLARRHVAYGVTADHLAAGGEALVGALADTLGGEITPNALRAWRELYDLAAAVMDRASRRAAASEGFQRL
jgi:hemoglobin-like flavoprotein